MKYNKIFVIGMNKTATYCIHTLFKKHGLSSQHFCSGWDLENYQCFSDGFSHTLLDNRYYFKKLYEEFPNSLFILNTRKLDKWLKSWITHNLEIKKWRPNLPECTIEIRHDSIEKIKSRISKRFEHHENVLDFFKDKSDQLLVVNTDGEDFQPLISKQIGFKKKSYTIRVNTSAEKMDRVDKIKLQESFDLLELAYADANIVDRDDLHFDPKYRNIYRSNVK